MRETFDRTRGLIVSSARLRGPTGETYARLALDAGATLTIVRTAVLVSIGCDPDGARDRIRITTGSGVASAPKISIARLDAIGQRRESMSILSHTLPASAGVDGLLGLDFFRGRKLVIDFRKGWLSLA